MCVLQSLSIDYGTLEMTVRFNTPEELSQAAQAIMLGDSAASKQQTDLQIVNFLRGGELINAIKYHRTQTGQSLKDSKQYVEQIGLASGLMERKDSGVYLIRS